MGRAALTVAAAALALLPGIAWLATPATPLAAVATGTLAVVAALHGLGRAVAVALDDRDAPAPLAIAWGLAAWLLLGGLLTAAGAFDAHGQRALGLAGVAAGAAWCARAAPVVGRPRWPGGPTILVAAIVAALATLHLLGAAATWTGAFADADAHLLGPLRRLADTSQLGDTIGLPRGAGLGGTVVAHALVLPLGDLRASHAIDGGIGFALALALMLLGRWRDRGGLALAAVIAMLASSTPTYPTDLAPRWIVVALVFAALHAWRRHDAPRGRLGAIVAAAGLATVSYAGVGLAIALLARLGAGSPMARRRAVWIGALIVAAAVGAYLIALARCPGPDGAVLTLLRPRRFAVRLAPAAFIGACWYAVAGLATRRLTDDALRAIGVATAAAVAGAIALTPAFGAVWPQIQPLGIAMLFVALDAALAPTPPPTAVARATVIAAVLASLTLATTRFPVGVPARSWESRLDDYVEAVRARVHQPSLDAASPEARAHAAALALAPANARVGVWTERPELVSYRGRRIVDLRSVDATRCVAIPAPRRWLRSAAACRRLAATLRRAALDYVVISEAAFDPDAGRALAPLCQLGWRAACHDPLAALVSRGRALPAPPGFRVIATVEPAH